MEGIANLNSCESFHRYARTHDVYQVRILISSQLKDWSFPVDNAFAKRLRAKANPLVLPVLDDTGAKLCQRCTYLDFEVGGFSHEESLTNLASSAASCDFCKMLEAACKQDKSLKGDHIQLERTQSNLKLANAEFPLFSLLRKLGMFCDSNSLVIPSFGCGMQGIRRR